MTALILILIFVFIAQVGFFINLAEAQRAEKDILEKTKKDVNVKKCPPHKWSYHPQTHILVCTACNLGFSGKDNE